MTFRAIVGAAAVLTLSPALPVQAQAYYPPEEILTSTLDQDNVRRYFEWNIAGNLGAVLSVSTSAGSSLSQLHGVRVCVCRPDGSVVADTLLNAGQSTSLTFNLSTGRYLVFFDLGVADPNDPIGQVNFSASGQLTNLADGAPVRIQPPDEDLPPDPDRPPPSYYILPGPVPLSGADLIPMLNGPSYTTMVILYGRQN